MVSTNRVFTSWDSPNRSLVTRRRSQLVDIPIFFQMESSSSFPNFAKLNEDNFHVWKKKVEYALILKDLDEFLEDDPPKRDDDPQAYKAWIRKDKKAHAFMAMSINDSFLPQVQNAETTKQLFKAICDIFEKHTLLNVLHVRRKFFTAKMEDEEKVNAFAARVRQLAETLKSMKVEITTQDMAMTFLCGLPDRFDSLISALDALAIDDDDKSFKNFTFEFVVSRCTQEESRHAEREKDAVVKSEAAALIASRKKMETKAPWLYFRVERPVYILPATAVVVYDKE